MVWIHQENNGVRPRIRVWRWEPISDIVTPVPPETAWGDPTVSSPTHRTGRRSPGVARDCAVLGGADEIGDHHLDPVGAKPNAMVTLRCPTGAQRLLLFVERVAVFQQQLHLARA
jgi:hypothetical protein